MKFKDKALGFRIPYPIHASALQNGKPHSLAAPTRKTIPNTKIPGTIAHRPSATSMHTSIN